MRQFAVILLLFVLSGCSQYRATVVPSEDMARQYSSTAVTLADFSKKIVAHYESLNLPVPTNFDTQQFFGLLEKIYPDQSRVKAVQNNYKVFVRSLDGGYSVMLCDPTTNQKIMEDLSCHINRVEIRSWQNDKVDRCVFEKDWRSYCQ